MMIIPIAAMTRERVIGKGGKLPWHLPEDLKFFKNTTMGHAVVMGRRTYDSVGKPLPGRRNIVITRRPAEILSQPPVRTERGTTSLDAVDSLQAAIVLCRERGETMVFIVGGGEIYTLAMPIADELYITHVPTERPIEGDTFFPAWSENEWEAAGPVDPSFPLAVRYVRRGGIRGQGSGVRNLDADR